MNSAVRQCSRCKRPALANHSECEHHRNLSRARKRRSAAQRRARFAEQGRCECGGVRVPGYRLCADCGRRRGTWARQRESAVAEQGGRCAICATEFNATTRPCLDHCHETGTIRGALCSRCNKGIGLLCDDPTVVLKALAYLIHHKGKPP